jgi:para-nitrobenzyl esterase
VWRVPYELSPRQDTLSSATELASSAPTCSLCSSSTETGVHPQAVPLAQRLKRRFSVTLKFANFGDGPAMRSLVIIFFASCTISALYPATSNPIVAVTGGRVRGVLLDPHAAVFKGIPYARPPVGEFRWREPAPVQAWKGVRDITEGPPCAQNPYFVHDAKITSREDCLYLNVWSPAWPVRSARTPVMVWIPGGGNFGGAWNSAVPIRYPSDKAAPAAEEVFRYDGVDLQVMKLVQRDVVLVTLNYRLGLFGFFSHPELTRESRHRASGNQGILDQIAALQWVHDNIAKFGGDPGNVTIFGESAGSFDVSVLMTSPLSRGLFRRAIAQSGAVILLGDPLPLPDAEKLGLSLARSWTASGSTDLLFLRALPMSAILDKEPNLLQKLPRNLGVSVDGYVFPERPRDVFAGGREHPVDMMLGNVAHEWVPGSRPPVDWKAAIENTYGAEIAKRAISLYEASGIVANYGGPAEQWAEDVGFRCPVVAQSVWHVAAGNRAFEYEFSRVPAGTKIGRNMHAQDVPFVFSPLPGPLFDTTDDSISDTVQRYWTNFARTGNPNGGGNLPQWPPFDASSRGYLEISSQGPIARKDLRRPYCDLLVESLKK